MTEYMGQHWIFTILITIFLGAIGSGLWEMVLKQFASKLGNALFSVITFGAKRANNRIFAKAAMGHHELPSLNILLTLTTFTLAILISIPLMFYITPKSILNNDLHIEVCANKGEVEKKECIRELIKNTMEPKIRIFGVISIFFGVIIFYRFHSINKMNLITTYYQQSLKAIRPYIDESRLYLIEQKYALMLSEKDYDHILQELASIASEHRATLPKVIV